MPAAPENGAITEDASLLGPAKARGYATTYSSPPRGEVPSYQGSRPKQRKPHKPVGFWALVALVFYTASGGPFGIEVSTCHTTRLLSWPGSAQGWWQGVVADVGPLWAILGYILFPVIWSIPEVSSHHRRSHRCVPEASNTI
jgi:hypothetical protein